MVSYNFSHRSISFFPADAKLQVQVFTIYTREVQASLNIMLLN